MRTQDDAHPVDFDYEATVEAARGRPKRFKCVKCGKAYASSSSLSQHRSKVCKGAAAAPAQLSAAPAVTNNITNINTNNITIHIHNTPLPFGHEDYAYLMSPHPQ